jgi:hypothetical protein
VLRTSAPLKGALGTRGKMSPIFDVKDKVVCIAGGSRGPGERRGSGFL